MKRRSGSACFLSRVALGYALVHAFAYALVYPLALALVLAPVTAAGAQAAAPIEFALIGDYPYRLRGEAGLPALLEDLGANPDLAFVLHVGDLHSPARTDCTELLFRSRRKAFVRLEIPFVLTPGDNDWADCPGSPLEALALLRRIFFADPERADGRDGFAMRSQGALGGAHAEFIENRLWQRAGVVFATLHLIGPGIVPIPDETAETRRRLEAAATAWLDEAFRVAREEGARGVFLATQVDLWPVSGNAAVLDLMYPGLVDVTSGFEAFERRLIEQVRAFDGPVVLANGDTHSFRVDKPLHDGNLETLETFTRVEGFGSPYGHWVRVRVEPDRPEVFSFRQEIVEANVFTRVPRAERRDGFEDDRLARYRRPLRILQAIPNLLALVGAFAILRWGFGRVRRWRAR